MASSSDAFSLNDALGVTTGDEQRQRKLQTFQASGLKGLFNQPTDQPEDTTSSDLLSKPLYDGSINKDTGTPTDTGTSESNQPSALATERVGRSPAYQEASPLLGQEERIGNLATGEEGQYGPLTGQQRSLSLKNFFGDKGSKDTQSSDVTNDVGGAGQDLGTALGYSKLANSVGTSTAKYLTQNWDKLFGKDATDFSYGGLNSKETADLLNTFDPEGAAGIDNTSLADEIGQSSELAGEAGSNVGGTIGAAGSAAGLGISLASLINSLVHGQLNEGKSGQLTRTAITSMPSIASLAAMLGGAAGPTTLGLSGVGLAYLPLMVPTIMNLISSLTQKQPNISQLKSQAAANQIPSQLNDYLLQQNNPLSLIGLATGAKSLSPHDEVMMRAGGNNWGSEGYDSLLQGVLNGDPQATQDFLRSVEITSGETGGVHNVNAQATDTYRRQLAHALGLTPEQTQGMFNVAPSSEDPSAWNYARRMDNTMQSLGQFSDAQLMDLFNSIPNSVGANDFGHSSAYYRDPSEGGITADTVPYYQNLIQQAMDYRKQHPDTYIGGDQ